MDEEVRLVGGRSTSGVVRIADTVHRPAGPWTETIHAFPRHVRSRGCTAVPEPLGFDGQGREVLEFIHGDALATPQDPEGPLILAEWPAPWRSDAALRQAARMIAGLHSAAAGFRTDNATWRLYDHPMRPGQILCHGDYGPWNTVYRDGLPFAFIDWDSLRPDEALFDLASAAWHFVPLVDAAGAAALGFDGIDHGRRLRLFLDAYGMDASSRAGFARTLQTAKEREADHVRFWALDPERSAGYIGDIAAEIRWLGANARDIAEALA